jgi:excisionase family DNA binding protein
MAKRTQRPLPELCTTAQVAKYLSIHPQTLVRWRIEGVGPKYRKLNGDRLIRYERQDVRRWVQAQKLIQPRNEM